MAIYASSTARGTQRVDVVSLGAISALQSCTAPGQLHIASGTGPAPGRALPKAVHATARQARHPAGG